MIPSTTTDVTGDPWPITDRIVRIREWGSDTMYWLAPDAKRELLIGKDPGCAIRLSDRHVSRQHAELSYDGHRWLLRDLGSKNGVRVDGVRRDLSTLEPGMELEVGHARLLVESERLIELRVFLRRVLGWGIDKNETVDLALRSVRSAGMRRAVLMLCGKGDLVPVAADLHRRAFGLECPFVLCDPRRVNSASAVVAMEAAAGGTLCLRRDRLPRDFHGAVTALREPGTRTVLVVCARKPDSSFPCAAIEVPPLTARGPELGRVIDEYAAEARAQLQAVAPFTQRDREWVQHHSGSSLGEIEKGTSRLVAMRVAGNVTRAAALLGLSHTSLNDWLKERRSLPASE